MTPQRSDDLEAPREGPSSLKTINSHRIEEDCPS